MPAEKSRTTDLSSTRHVQYFTNRTWDLWALAVLIQNYFLSDSGTSLSVKVVYILFSVGFTTPTSQSEKGRKLTAFQTVYSPTCRALKITTGVRGERVALLSRSCSNLFCRPRKSVGGVRVCVPQYCTELKASGKRESFLKRSDSRRSTDSNDLSKNKTQSVIRMMCWKSLSICIRYNNNSSSLDLKMMHFLVLILVKERTILLKHR